MKLWFIIKEEELKGLKALQLKEYGTTLKPPDRDGKPVVLKIRVESLEEVGELMARAPVSRKVLGG